MKKSFVLYSAVLLSLLALQSTKAAAFSTGSLVVLQVGDGSATLSGSATAGFISEFSVAGGAAIQTIALPTTAGLGQFATTFGGTATTEGQLQLSADGHYLTYAGYNAAVGSSTPGSTTAAVDNRVVGLIGANGSLDTSTAISSGTSGTVRSAVSSDGTHFWVGSSSAGVGATTLGSSAAIQLSTTPSNVRVVGLYANQLYTSAASGVFQGIASIGTGAPTTAGQTTTALNGFPTATGPSPYDYFFASATTLYVADDRTTVGGIQKWTLTGGTWSLAYLLTPAAGVGARSLAVDMSGANPIIYAITTGNQLVSIVDGGAAATGDSVLETAAANTAFRGLAFAPTVIAVPEPATLALATMGGIACLVALRRKR